MVTSPTVNIYPNAPPGSASPATKLIAFYLPQYHPIPENDAWWGKGFTEWINVVRAQPLFPGHYQPHLPADLGFYDLRLPEVREAQAELAKDYGIYGFCYYHYWFNGQRILERPFREVLDSGKPDFPFCLCWANENWTRRWDGQEQQILLKQTYSQADDLNHIRWLVKAFADRRYIRVEGKPLFLVYRPGDLPCAAQTANTWREEAQKAGIGDIFLCAVATTFPGSPKDSRQIGFDALLEFQPTFPRWWGRNLVERVWRRFRRGVKNHVIIDYSELIKQSLERPTSPCRWFHTVLPSWDNSARRKTRALILDGASPQKYSEWLELTIDRSKPLTTGEKLVFVNAWNEWGEGNHLEPCQRWGRTYLEATRAVVDRRDLSVKIQF